MVNIFVKMIIGIFWISCVRIEIEKVIKLKFGLVFYFIFFFKFLCKKMILFVNEYNCILDFVGVFINMICLK